MIALDTSALIAMVANEPEGLAFQVLVAQSDCLIGAPSRLEAAIWPVATRAERRIGTC